MYRLSKDIKETLAYYDVLDFPLTAFETWKHLLTLQEEIRPSSYYEVVIALQREVANGVIEQNNGFYFLSGRLGLVTERIRREKLSVAKLKRIRRLARYIRYTPYVRFLGATGSLSLKYGDIESDWDLFVVLRTGKIWTGRVLLTGVLFIMGKWRHGKHIKNRACLNYFIADKSLKIGTRDLFAAHEYRFMIPLFNYGLFQRFELKNHWMANMKPNFSLSEIPALWTLKEIKKGTLLLQAWLEKIGDYFDIESFLAVRQRSKIAKNPKTHWKGSYIETSNQALIFLPRPRGPRVYEAFKQRIGML